MSIPRRSVNILLYGTDGRVLLQMRDGTAPLAPLCWSLWGGALVTDEAATEGAARELLEELGILAGAEAFEQLDVRASTSQTAVLVRCLRPLSWRELDVREGAGAAFFWRSELARIATSRVVAFYLAQMPELFAERHSGPAARNPLPM